MWSQGMFHCWPSNPGPTGRGHRVGDQVSQMSIGRGMGGGEEEDGRGKYGSLLGMKGARAEDRQGF